MWGGANVSQAGGVGDGHSPADRRFLQADAQVAQRRLDGDVGPQVDRRDHHDRGHRIGQDVVGDDAPRTGPQGTCGLDVVVGHHLQHRGSHEPGDGGPSQDDDGPHHLEDDDDVRGADPVGEGVQDDDAAQQERDRVEDVTQSREQTVQPTAAESGDEADDRAQDRRAQGGEHSDEHGGTGTVDGACVDVAPLHVGAEPVHRRGQVTCCGQVAGPWIRAGEQSGGGSHEHEDDDEHRRDPEQRVVFEVVPCVVPEGAGFLLPGVLPGGHLRIGGDSRVKGRIGNGVFSHG